MSEETNTEASVESANDGTWSSLKKTIIGTLTTLIAGGGTWLGVVLFQGGEDKGDESPKTEQAAPAQQPMILNIDNSSKNSNSSNGGGTTIIHEKVVEKPAKEEKKKEEKSESSDAPW